VAHIYLNFFTLCRLVSTEYTVVRCLPSHWNRRTTFLRDDFAEPMVHYCYLPIERSIERSTLMIVNLTHKFRLRIGNLETRRPLPLRTKTSLCQLQIALEQRT
jgi:hypothetical protein